MCDHIVKNYIYAVCQIKSTVKKLLHQVEEEGRGRRRGRGGEEEEKEKEKEKGKNTLTLLKQITIKNNIESSYKGNCKNRTQILTTYVV